MIPFIKRDLGTRPTVRNRARLAARWPDAAPGLWPQRLPTSLRTRRGLASALHSGDPAYAALPADFRARFEPALAGLRSSAAATGRIRGDVAACDLLRAIGNLSFASDAEGTAHTHRMLDLLIDGLRRG